MVAYAVLVFLNIFEDLKKRCIPGWVPPEALRRRWADELAKATGGRRRELAVWVSKWPVGEAAGAAAMLSEDVGPKRPLQ